MSEDPQDRRPTDEESAAAGVGRQSGQQREHGHESREDQLRDQQQQGQRDAQDDSPSHPDASPASVVRGRPGGTG
jgi:hypothetical protein